MALSGSFNTTKYSTSSHGTLGLNVSWTATQNIANNTSTIKWTVKSNGTMSSGYYVKCYKVIVKINGVNVINTTSEFNMRGDGGYKKTGSIVVAHGEDGTKTVAMSAQANIYYAGDGNAQKGSKSFTLNTINRYALISSATDFTNESYPTIVYTNPAGSTLTTGLKVRLMWNSRANYTSWVDLNNEGGTYTFDNSSLTSADITSMLASCPDSNTLPVEVCLASTMDNVEYYDYKSIVMNVVNSNPTFSVAPTYEDANDDIYAITGNRSTIVRKQSKLHIFHGTASAQNGASLATDPYSLNFNGQDITFTGNYVEFDKPDIAGTYRATVTATDTRGNTSTSYVDIVILDWAEPTADCSLARQNSFETDCDLLVNASISSVDNINTLTITAVYRVAGTQPWSDPPISVRNNTVELVQLDNTNAWELQVSVADKFMTKTYTLTVSKGIPYRYKDRKRNSFGFNAIPDADYQFKIGEGCHAKIDGVKYPHKYSTTEQIVGYWIDGSPIYEKTIEFQSAVTVNANAWNTNVYTNDEDIIVLNGESYYYDSNSSVYVYWGFMAIQSNTTDKTKVNLYNSRDSSCQVSILVIRYIKPTQNNS